MDLSLICLQNDVVPLRIVKILNTLMGYSVYALQEIIFHL